MKHRRAAKLAEAALWSVATLTLGVSAAAFSESYHAEKQAASLVAPSSRALPAEAAEPFAVPAAGRDSGASKVIGRLVIPDLALAVPVINNYDPASLTRGVGHIPGTATPGGLGNLGLAGHRDTFFRPLRNARPGMKIEITTAGGRFSYQIDSTEIVDPDQVRVLDIGDRPEMTLITCYPFEYIGAAPRRFIVHAHLLSVDPA